MKARRYSTRTRLAAVAAVFACALGVRLVYATEALATIYGHEQERYRIAHFYHEAAAALAEGEDVAAFPSGVAPDETLIVGYPPGYFVLSGAIYRATGNSMGAVLIAQCLLDAVTAALLVLLGEALFSLGAGVVAGLLMALSPQFAYLSLVVKPDTITVLPVVVALLLVARALDRPALWKWIVAGLSLGVACWLRQNALLFAPVLGVVAMLAGGWREHWRGAALLVATCAVAVAPITIRNLVVYGRPIPVTVGSGFALLSGLARDDHAGRYGLPRFAYNYSVEEATRRGLAPEHFFAEYDRRQAGRARRLETKHTVLSLFVLDGIERDAERRAEAMRLIASDPVYFASIYWIRVQRLMGYTEQNRPVPLETARGARAHETLAFYEAVDPRWGRWRYYAERGSWYDFARPMLAAVQRVFVTPVVLGLALVGLALALWRDWRATVLVAAPAVYYVGLQSLMWAEFRHTLPAHVAVFVLVGVLASTVGGWARRRIPAR